MSQYSHEMRRRIDRRHRRSHTAEDARKSIAREITGHILAKQLEHPDITEFSTPLQQSIGRLETYLLRHQRSEIIGLLAVDATVTMEYDEEAEPPLLRVSLDSAAKNES